LGVITQEVEALRDNHGFPGMKILQFAFGSGPANAYLPHNHISHCVVYTGTHDNDTSAGWYAGLSDKERCEVRDYLGSTGADPADDLIRAALMSVADTAIIPFQDLLGLPTAARMNVPGRADGNWEWRFTWDMIDKDMAECFRRKLELFGRCR
jgi:4-alpha-glucanotransferase